MSLLHVEHVCVLHLLTGEGGVCQYGRSEGVCVRMSEREEKMLGLRFEF